MGRQLGLKKAHLWALRLGLRWVLLLAPPLAQTLAQKLVRQ